MINPKILKNKKANIIREKLLIFSNKELQINKKNHDNNFLINSKPLESYENVCENYIIIEQIPIKKLVNYMIFYKKIKKNLHQMKNFIKLFQVFKIY